MSDVYITLVAIMISAEAEGLIGLAELGNNYSCLRTVNLSLSDAFNVHVHVHTNLLTEILHS